MKTICLPKRGSLIARGLRCMMSFSSSSISKTREHAGSMISSRNTIWIGIKANGHLNRTGIRTCRRWEDGLKKYRSSLFLSYRKFSAPCVLLIQLKQNYHHRTNGSEFAGNVCPATAHGNPDMGGF